MPISLAAMAANSARVTFQYEGESVTIEYYPNRINDAVIAQLDADIEACTQALATIIKSWDVYEDKEQTIMFPLDALRMKKLGFPFRLHIRQAIVRHMRPNMEAPQTPS